MTLIRSSNLSPQPRVDGSLRSDLVLSSIGDLDLVNDAEPPHASVQSRQLEMDEDVEMINQFRQSTPEDIDVQANKPGWHGGPTARYPFVSPHLHSCRPGGPRLYDILLELPSEPYGVMWWNVLENEQLLLEVEDVADEDKVMMALWNRWIFLNRSVYFTQSSI